MTDLPKPPSDLKRGGRGRQLWRMVSEALDLDGRDLAMLAEAARTLDVLDELAHLRRIRGSLTPDGRIAPYVVEARQQRITFARVLAAMRLPEDLSSPAVRPQRRAGARGFYTVSRNGGR